MQITISQRLRPFSHVPGTFYILPHSTLRLQIFPTLIKVDDLSKTPALPVGTITLNLEPMLAEFTVMQDLESGSILVWGKGSAGYMRYRITAAAPNSATYFTLYFEKTSAEGIACVSTPPHSLLLNEAAGLSVLKRAVQHHETLSFVNPDVDQTPVNPVIKRENIERLSLGNHKSQDWSLIQRRLDFSEIFPLWDRLGQYVNTSHENMRGGVFDLVDQCREAIEANARDKILLSFQKLFLAGFTPGLSPRLEDVDFQGFKLSPADSQSSALQLLAQGRILIRRLFITIEGDTISILPSLPSEFHAGRFLNVSCGALGTIDMEWSKKSIRRLVFTASCDATVNFCFAKEIKKYRLQGTCNTRGQWVLATTPLEIKSGVKYLFDCFEK